MKRYHFTEDGFTEEQFANLTTQDREEIGIAEGSSLKAANTRLKAFLKEQEKADTKKAQPTKKSGPARDSKGHFIKGSK